MDAVDMCYVSTACNRTNHAADWGQNDLICFGSCHAVYIYEPEKGNKRPSQITETLIGHKDKVNCVQWIQQCDQGNENQIVSGSVDTTVRVWIKTGSEYIEKACLKGHTLSVNAVCGVTIVTELHTETYVVSSSTDSTVKIWRCQDDADYEELQTINFGSGFCLHVAITVIPNTSVPLLAFGVDDHKIHLYTLHQNQFVKLLVLTGHENWVQSLDFTTDDNGDILLASCALDNLIRIWRFNRRDGISNQSIQSIKDLDINEDIRMRENLFSFDVNGSKKYYAVSLESVLCGHDNWIYSVKWQKTLKTDNGIDKNILSLLSASMDKTMILWKPDPESHVWVEQVRVGEVGGNTLGFYGGMFSPDGNSIIAHGYHGAFHHWSFNASTQQWESSVTGGGHFDIVEDIDWDRDGGQFLLSTSKDQTTRLHAPWVSDNRPVKWYEIARPQVHGYDIQCLTMINRYKFASGADEKVPRVFEAPQNFLQNFCKICNQNLETELNKKETKSLPEGASVPALGLSNKAVFGGEQPTDNSEEKIKWGEQYPEVYFHPQSLAAPPSEENLLQNTLWPECQKLYGHGYEIFAIACSHNGKILATACKATKAEYANIILWDVESWKEIRSLEGPTLTVTRLAFSHNDCYLLAVSRDRTWTLYSNSTGEYIKECYVDKKTTSHSRIIWDCCWSHDDKYFITTSRDKKVIIWCVKDILNDKTTPPKLNSFLEFSDSVTAVDVAPLLVDNSYLLSIGLDDGTIYLYKWKPNETLWTKCVKLCQKYSHHLTVKRLKFRPCLGQAGQTDERSILQLASCSSDHCVRVYNINLDQL